MAAVAGEIPFVGREAQLAELEARLDAAGRGQGGAVFITGEAGIGKTRLLDELARSARSLGWQVLAGAAYDSGGMPPYLPFAEALREHIDRCPADVLQAQLGAGAAEVALLFPAIRSHLPNVPPSSSLSPELERYRLFESVADFVVAVARAPIARQVAGAASNGHASGAPRYAPGGGAGLLLILDDLHWADTPTLLLLQHIARRIREVPLLMVGAYRRDEAARGGDGGPDLADIALDLRRARQADVLDLPPLTMEQSSTFIAGLMGAPAAPSVVAAIQRETAGNPFFLEEVLHQLRVENRDLTDAAALDTAWTIPEGARRMINRRLARLSDAAQRLLQAGALLGDPFTFDLLADLTEEDVLRLLDGLEEALAAGIVHEERDGYRFRHALIRESLVRAVSQPRRELFHARAAEALRARYADEPAPYLGMIAAHYRHAGAAYRARALEFTEQAAVAATAVYAWEAAAAHWEAALPLLRPTDDVRRTDALLALGQAHLRAGAVDLAAEALQEAASTARRLGRTEVVVQAALTFGAKEIAGGRVDARQIGLLDEALALVGEAETPLRATLLARLAHALFWSPNVVRRAALTEEALALARRAGDAASLAAALSARHVTVWTPDNAEERLALAQEMLRLAEAAGDRELALQAQRWRVVDLLELCDIDGMDEAIGAHRRLAEETRQPFYLYYVRLFAAMRVLLAGRFTEGSRLAHEAFALGQRAGHPDALAFFSMQVLEAHRGLGRLEEARPQLEALIARYPSVPGYRVGIALVHIELDSEAEARREFEALAARDFSDIQRTSAWLPALYLLAQICAGLADRQRAAILYELLLPYADRCAPAGAVGTCVGVMAHALARLATVLSRFDAAEEHFEAALARLRRMGARALLAETEHAYAQMLLARHGARCAGSRRMGQACDHRARAADLLGHALGAARELGMTRLMERIERAGLGREEATDAKERAATAATAAASSLSPREIEVLRLLAAGATNREIAEALVIAPPTVARHIASIYAKTGARRRADATAYAIRRGLAGEG